MWATPQTARRDPEHLCRGLESHGSAIRVVSPNCEIADPRAQRERSSACAGRPRPAVVHYLTSSGPP